MHAVSNSPDLGRSADYTTAFVPTCYHESMGPAAKTRTKTKLEILHADLFRHIPRLVHGFSTRQGGVSKAYGGRALNLGFTAHDSRAAVQSNRDLFVRVLEAGA